MDEITEKDFEPEYVYGQFNNVYYLECSPEQKQQILQALELKKEIDDIKQAMQTSKYLYSGEFVKYLDDRLKEILKPKIPSTDQVK